MQRHIASGQCQKYRKCLKCQAEYTVIEGKRHKCGYAQCRVCKTFQHVATHKCFIQPVTLSDEEEEEELDDDISFVTSSVSDNERRRKRKPLPPLFVYADFEALQTPQKLFVPNLLCYIRADNDECQFLWGESCGLDFLEVLDDMTESPDEEREQPIIVVFHNLKGFDGMFLLQELYR